MSDFNKQAQDTMKQGEQLTKTWMDTQKQMLDNYTQIVQTMMGMGTKSSASELEGDRKKALDIMENSVAKGFDFQAEMTRMYLQNMMNMMRLPDPMNEGAKQLQEIVMNATASQKSLAHMYFEIARNYGSGASMESWQEQGQRTMETWQNAAKQVSDAQKDMAQKTAEAGQKTAKAAK